MKDETEKIDLNQADVDTLKTLPGIGTVLAERIVEFRETIHPFEEVIELSAVPGISERMVRAVEEQVMVAVAAPPEQMLVEGVGSVPEFRESVGEEEMPELDAQMATVPDLESEPAPEPDDETELEAEGEDEEMEEPPTPLVPEEADAETTDAEAEEADLAAAPPPPETIEDEPDDIVETRMEPPPIPERVAPPPTPYEAKERPAQRRGCLAIILGAILGTFGGAILGLAILAALNEGALTFAAADTRLRRELGEARQVQDELTDRLASLDAQSSDLGTRTAILAQAQAEAESAVEDSLAAQARTIEDIQGEIAAIEETADELDERITRIAAAAETFDAFLNRLRDLLFDLQGAPPSPTPTATATKTATPTSTSMPAAADMTLTPTASPTGIEQPTRTPRPTATPFALPTSTPEPQP